MTQLDTHIRRADDHRAPSKALTGHDLAEVVRLLKCKLAWYGFQYVSVGPFITMKGQKVLIDLLDRDEVLCRIELDAESGIPDPGHVIQTALNPSLLTQGQASKGINASGDSQTRHCREATPRPAIGGEQTFMDHALAGPPNCRTENSAPR